MRPLVCKDCGEAIRTCPHCGRGNCACEFCPCSPDDFDADELGLDPEEGYDA